MPISKKLLTYLDKNKVKYTVVSHRKVFTAFDAAQTQHIKPQTVVKTLVVKLDNEYGLALVPASKHLDFKKLKVAANTHHKKLGLKAVKSVSLAKEVWMKKNVVGQVGATPPFGGLMKLPVYADRAIFKNKKIIVNTGDYTQSLEILSSALLKVEQPFLASLTK